MTTATKTSVMISSASLTVNAEVAAAHKFSLKDIADALPC